MSSIKPGSAILIVIFFSTILLVMLTSAWYDTMYLRNLAYMRGRAYQRNALVEGLLFYGVAQAERMFAEKSAAEEIQPFMVEVDPWPSKDCAQLFGHYKGKILLSSKESIVTVNAQLSSDDCGMQNGSCSVAFDAKKPEFMRIAQWSIDVR